MSANTSGIPSVDLLESYEGAELLWILHSRFDGRALTALNQFLQYSQTLKLISKRNQKDWEFIDDGLENDSIPIVLLKKLFDKLEYGIVTCFKQRLCDREENKLKGMLLVPEEDDKVLLSQLATRFTMLVQNPPKYISIESGVYNTEVLKSLHSTKIRWLRRDLTEAKYLANLEKGTFTRDNLGFPSMEKIALKYGIKKSLISTCTPFTGTKNTKNKFDTENYPLYAGNVASLIHFYSSVIVQLFERLSTFCQCMPESTTITSAARNSPEYIALFSRNLDSVVDPFKGGIPTVLKRMLGLQEKIASSADLFFLYHKYIPIEFPKYIPGFWKNKLDILTIFVDYGDVFVKFFQEVSKLKVNPLENFLSANDVVVARIITRLLSALKEFLDDLSNEKLQAYRVFFYVPRLLDLRGAIQECIRDINQLESKVDLLPIIDRIDKHLFITAQDCKSVFTAGAMHFAKGSDVIACFERITGQKFDLQEHLKDIALKLFNFNEIFDEQGIYSSGGFTSNPKMWQETLGEYISNHMNLSYKMWQIVKAGRFLSVKAERDFFLKRKITVTHNNDGDKFSCTYQKAKETDVIRYPSITDSEKLSCDNIIAVYFLTTMLSRQVAQHLTYEGIPSPLIEVIKYLRCIHVISSKTLGVTIYEDVAQERLSRLEQWCRIKLLMADNDAHDVTALLGAFQRSISG